MKTPLILIADDDAVLRDVYTRKFTTAGFTVVAARDGGEVVALAKEHTPSAMLCDIRMNHVDGWSVLEALPRATRSYPIIMVTNFDRTEDRAKAEELGADGYVVKKDVTISGLVETVKKYMTAWRA